MTARPFGLPATNHERMGNLNATSATDTEHPLRDRHANNASRKNGRDARDERDAISPSMSKEGIAIIGIGCRFPGNVNNAESFWRLLAEGREAVCEVPPDRWNV